MLGIHHGFGFSAGAIDFFLNLGIAQRPWLLFGIGLIYGLVYFLLFYFLIKKLNLKTPGREDEEEVEPADEGEPAAASGNRYDRMAAGYLRGLGGGDNIDSLDNCTTRLHLKLKDMSKVDEAALKRSGAKGLLKLAVLTCRWSLAQTSNL
ncbi:hypothetical protein GCM10011571_16790 [Marinithermofilum abyssi]|uniref:PTS EIIB type-1 domain-containing protein n=1 Tax=Marinithermofilum abyssi TaxID=1571185 RepID=A0A8J2VF28_9BACL|nr:hypothetical protein GCM10011571_16790 [Marinithermofilum abyssi]